MVSHFHFKNYEADEATKTAANLALSRVLDSFPDDSKVVAVLEKQGEYFGCSMEIYSRQGPFMTTAVRPHPVEAIQVVQEKLKSQLAWRRSHWVSEPKNQKEPFFKAVS